MYEIRQLFASDECRTWLGIESLTFLFSSPLGNKKDLRNDEATKRELMKMKQEPVRGEAGRTMAEKIGAVGYLECSAKTKEGQWTAWMMTSATGIDSRCSWSLRIRCASCFGSQEETKESMFSTLKEPNTQESIVIAIVYLIGPDKILSSALVHLFSSSRNTHTHTNTFIYN